MGDGTQEKPKKPVDRNVVPAESTRIVLGSVAAAARGAQTAATALVMIMAFVGTVDGLSLDGSRRGHEDRAARYVVKFILPDEFVSSQFTKTGAYLLADLWDKD